MTTLRFVSQPANCSTLLWPQLQRSCPRSSWMFGGQLVSLCQRNPVERQYVFSDRLKRLYDKSGCLRSVGRQFQTRGPTALNESIGDFPSLLAKTASRGLKYMCISIANPTPNPLLILTAYQHSVCRPGSVSLSVRPTDLVDYMFGNRLTD